MTGTVGALVYETPAAAAAVGRRALVAGLIALAACLVGGLFSPEQFFRSYLLAFTYWSGVALGCLAILMIQHLTGGAWGLVIRRLLESAAGTLPLVALLFLPVAFGVRHLYVWARPEAVQADPLLQVKQLYLNVPFFLARAGVYLLVWNMLAYVLIRWSRAQDRAEAPPDRWFRLLSAPGLLLWGLTVTFAAVDWIMSLEPRWYSTIFGVLAMGGHGLAAFAFVTASLFLLTRAGALGGIVLPKHFHDLGNLMLAFVMLWTYFSFSQLLIIWSGNLPAEVTWYVHRSTGGWLWVGVLVAAGQFALPFLLLLSRGVKRNARALGTIAVLILAMRLVDQFWLIAPGFHPEGLSIHWMDLVAPIGVGGVWVASYARQLQRQSLLPVNDPYLRETLFDARS